MVCALVPGLVSAQSREIDVDAILVSGVVTYAWEHSPNRYFGVLAGAGWDELGRTLTIDRDDPEFHQLEQILYVGGLHRWRASRWDLDVGVRTGLGSVRSGGDLPGVFAGVYGAALYGGKRFKVGPRVHFVNVWDFDESDHVIHLDPIVGRVSFWW